MLILGAPNVYAVPFANKFTTLGIDLDIKFLKQSANEHLSILMLCILLNQYS